ncbi:DNA repair protein RecO [Ornithinibacillus halotolerans]|uniref:DNA repair protein RecO n=1 Tax=Ornithinibacillus halotolerans TaxID=1274357 RepID=A0A916RSR1_9BACI|nr:DNA repair protein RecO [Ornithinibacillus halotolerans]GGA68600.1 DNA repair protein RecO [Ornithinibacillus halotolerans]
MLERIDGIVIKTKDYGETHKIVTIFSKKIGKFSAIARGAKKPKSRMAAVTQPFIYGEFFVYLNKGLGTIQQGEIIDSFRKIREDIIKTSYAAYIVELTEKLLDEKKPNLEIYTQFVKTLEWISEHEQADIPIMMYEMKLFAVAGFAPTVDRCINCGGKNAPFSFSMVEGGLLCSRCRHVDMESVQLSTNVVKLLYLFAKVGLERVGNVSVKEENKLLLRQLLDNYYDRYGGYYLKTRKFLNQLNKFK